MWSKLRLARWLLVLSAVSLASAQVAPARQPCDNATFERYRQLYAGDPKLPLNATIVKSEDHGGTKVDEIAFDSVNGQRVPGLLLLPPSTKPRALAVALHGLGGSKDDVLRAAPLLATFGVDVAILALDAPGHGARKPAGADAQAGGLTLDQARQWFLQGVVDYRRAIDYAVTRPEIDPQRIGVLGMSMGAMMGTILTAVEPRIKSAVLAVGGADWQALIEDSPAPFAVQFRQAHPQLDWAKLLPLTDPVDPLNFAAHLAPRSVLLLNATNDEIIPRRCSDALHAAATGDPVVKEWYDSGHLLPPELVGMRILAWLQEKL